MPQTNTITGATPNQIRIGDRIFSADYSMITTGKKALQYAVIDSTIVVTDRKRNRVNTEFTAKSTVGSSEEIRFIAKPDATFTVMREEETEDERMMRISGELQMRVRRMITEAEQMIAEYNAKIGDSSDPIETLLYDVKWGRIETLMLARAVVDYGNRAFSVFAQSTGGWFTDALDYVEAGARRDALGKARPIGSKSTNGWSNAIEDTEAHTLMKIANGHLRGADEYSSTYGVMVGALRRLGIAKEA